MTIAEVFLILGLLWTFLALIVLAVIAVLALRVVDRIYPPHQQAHDAPVPSLSAVAAAAPRRRKQVPLSVTALDESEEPLRGVHAHPVDAAAPPPQIGDDSERAMLEEREEGWRALRDEGYTDEEIAEMERSSAIQVFD